MARFSLILPTINRVDEVDRCLASLAEQSCRSVQIIIVDQNPDCRLDAIIARHRNNLDLKVITLDKKGSSRARNAGLANATGDIVGFPDDDCWYAPDVLERIDRQFSDHPDWGVISGRALGPNGTPLAARKDETLCSITPKSVWRLSIEFTMFCRRELLDSIGVFDESLGINSGTRWGSGEGTDLLLRAIDSGAHAMYDPEIRIYHPDWTLDYSRETIAKAYRYARGTGRVLRVHSYPIWLVIYFIFRPLAGVLISVATLNPKKARHHFANFLGRVGGWIAKA